MMNYNTITNRGIILIIFALVLSGLPIVLSSGLVSNTASAQLNSSVILHPSK
jgi:hypothetical protein